MFFSWGAVYLPVIERKKELVFTENENSYDVIVLSVIFFLYFKISNVGFVSCILFSRSARNVISMEIYKSAEKWSNAICVMVLRSPEYIYVWVH